MNFATQRARLQLLSQNALNWENYEVATIDTPAEVRKRIAARLATAPEQRRAPGRQTSRTEKKHEPARLDFRNER